MKTVRCSAFVASVLIVAGPVATAGPSVLSEDHNAVRGTLRPEEGRLKINPTREYEKGLAALDAKDFATADEAFGRVLSVVPWNVQTLIISGYTKSKLGRFDDARDAYGRALALDPTNILAHEGHGLALAQLGDKEGAAKELETLRERITACADNCPQASQLKNAVQALETAAH